MRAVANRLQSQLTASARAHDAIEARPGVAGASARLGKCLDLFDATSAFQGAASIRRSILDTLASVDVNDVWPQANTFLQTLTTSEQAAMQADEDFAAWGEDLQGGCSPATAHDDPNYQQGAELANRFSDERHLVALEWDKLVERYPGLGLTPVAPRGLTL